MHVIAFAHTFTCTVAALPSNTTPILLLLPLTRFPQERETMQLLLQVPAPNFTTVFLYFNTAAAAERRHAALGA
jgi:hypothetical protein